MADAALPSADPGLGQEAVQPTGERPDRTTRSQRHHRRIPLRLALAGGFGLAILLGLGTVMGLALFAGLQNTRDLVGAKVQLILEEVIRRTEGHLGQASELVRFLATDAHSNHALHRETALRAALAAVPHIRSVAFVGLDRRATMAVRESDGPVTLHEDWTGQYDIDAVFRRMATATRPAWGTPVLVRDYDGPGSVGAFLYVRMPVRSRGRLIGGYVASVELGTLSQELRRFNSGFGETAFILVGTDRVIAHPNFRSIAQEALEEQTLPPITALDDPVLHAAFVHGLTEPPSQAGPPGLDVVAVTPADTGAGDIDDAYILVSREVPGFGTAPWTVGVHFRAADIGAGFYRLNKAAIASLVVIAVIVGVALLLARGIAQPIRRLEAAAQRLQIEGPASVGFLPASHIRETDTAALAFNSMTEGLRDRELMRETFGRYVPAAIVPAILADHGVLKPTTRDATILFTDIQGFSTISERLPPERLIAMLNAYFEVVVAPIEAQGGVIHQFQGDAILATFNLPVDDADHAARAVQTALDIQDVLVRERFDGGDDAAPVELVTRIGINTGLITGGTVGAGGRLGYTVHGDHVNVAARIEELNKLHGTRVLVSERTVAACGDRFVFTPMGRMPMRGRVHDATLFRVVGPHTPFETPTLPG